jgi:hypothetical protein
MRNVLYELKRRGRSWFERTIRIGNAFFLRNTWRGRSLFGGVHSVAKALAISLVADW